MKSRLMVLCLATLVSLIGLAGCTSAVKPDANYQLQLEMVQKLYDSQAQAQEKLANQQQLMIAACQGDAACVREVALNNTLQTLAVRGGSGQTAPNIPSYQRRESFWEKAGLTLLGAAIPGYVSVRQSDNATRANIAQINATAQSTNALYGMLDNFVGNVQPNITINGRDGAGIGNSYSSADGNTTTTGDGNAVGTGNSADNSRGQINGDGNNNSGRIGSAGPWNWENSNNGGNCPGGNGGDGGGAPGSGSGSAGADGGDCSGGG